MKLFTDLRRNSLAITLVIAAGGCPNEDDGGGESCNIWGPVDDTSDDPTTPTGGEYDPCDFSARPPAMWSFRCLNDLEEDYNYWDNAGGYPVHTAVDVCVELDPALGTWEAEARTACSKRCDKLKALLTSDSKCVDADWSSVIVNGVSCNYQTCTVPTSILDFDLIETVLGSAQAQDAADLDCDLELDCLDYLDPDALAAMTTPGYANARDTAATLIETFTGSSNVNIFGFGVASPGIPKEIAGTAAYSAFTCAEDACPFYLAQLELTTVLAATYPFVINSTSYTKVVSGGTLSLTKPAMGMWLPATGDVIFPANSISVQGSATLTGSPEFAGENGFHEGEVLVRDYLFGRVDPVSGEFSISSTGEVAGISWDLFASFVLE